MIEEFKLYVSNFDMNATELKRKYYHSLRVMDLAKKYAQLLAFSEKDIELATVIGLLHDIGRFEQFKRYHTFDDKKSVDHANLGVKILLQNGLIKKFYETNCEEDYKIIEFAIRNHNKLAIEATQYDERYLKHAKLIRDIDKIDLLLIAGTLVEWKGNLAFEEISPLVIECIKQHTSVDRKYVKNIKDKLVLKFGFAFDVNYDICLKELKDNLIKFYDCIDNKDRKLQDVYEEVLRYINCRLGE